MSRYTIILLYSLLFLSGVYYLRGNTTATTTYLSFLSLLSWVLYGGVGNEPIIAETVLVIGGHTVIFTFCFVRRDGGSFWRFAAMVQFINILNLLSYVGFMLLDTSQGLLLDTATSPISWIESFLS
jgi:hypothetical protein